MHATTLYVVGNGFDLRHGVPSSYEAFRDYVRSVDRAIFRDVQEYLSTDENWSDLESSLAHFDVEQVVDNLGYFMGSYGDEEWSDAGHHDFQYEVGNVVERLSTGLRARFADWIRSLPIPTETTRLKHLDPEAYFFNFNYTNTLESLYSVDTERILFIHGCADRGDDLVLGHAWSPSTRQALNGSADPESTDTRLWEANSTMDSYFAATFKPCDQIIAKNQAFFDSLADVEQVIVLGHGLADVDAAYYRALLSQDSIRQAQWRVACRYNENQYQKRSRLAQFGVDPANVHCVNWDSL